MEIYNNISNLLSINNNIKLIGSLKLFGDYKKACDVDFQESIDSEVYYDKLPKYFAKLLEFKKQHRDFHLLNISCDVANDLIDSITQELGYMDGIFSIHNFNSERLIEIINHANISKMHKDELYRLIKDYQEIPKPKQYIVLRNYIYRNFNKTIPFTHIKKLLKTGLFTIQSTQYNLYSTPHSFLYIEVYFEKMIWSNYIIHGGEKIIFNHIRTPLDSLILNDNFSYYRFIKKFKVLLKWLYGKRYIESPHLQKQALVTCDKITEFIGKLALQYNEYCLIASRMILLSIKIAKYNKKIKKRTKPLYGERLDRLNALYTKLSLEYGEGIKSLESTYRDEVISMMTPYKLYLEKYFIIY